RRCNNQHTSHGKLAPVGSVEKLSALYPEQHSFQQVYTAMGDRTMDQVGVDAAAEVSPPERHHEWTQVLQFAQYAFDARPCGIVFAAHSCLAYRPKKKLGDEAGDVTRGVGEAELGPVREMDRLLSEEHVLEPESSVGGNARDRTR